jgi:hypothetical protein
MISFLYYFNFKNQFIADLLILLVWVDFSGDAVDTSRDTYNLSVYSADNAADGVF